MNARSLTLAASLALASSALAQNFVGLNSGGISLATFNTSGVATTLPIIGLGADPLVDIDYRVQDGLLYGMATSGTLYKLTLNVGTATATIDVAPPYTNTGGGAAITFTPTAIDFNPAANRLRVYAGTANYRLSPSANTTTVGATSDGTLTYDAGSMFAGQTAALAAAAYINNDTDAGTGTTLYSIDAARDYLVVHPASGGPAFSLLTAQDLLQVGGTGPMIDFADGTTGFDVLTVGATNTAYVSNGNTIYTVGLNGGLVGGTAGDLTLVTTVTGASITDIAVIPEPTSAALLAGAMGVFGMMRRRRNA